ncbi:hypothetical protein ONZ45_g7737 [Pleurotus djamor]|nr:hypothetical protein ONZ45_g7737 [Pleurotus djamor]
MPSLQFLTTLIISCSPKLSGLSLSWITQFLRHTENLEDINLHWISNEDLVASPDPVPISLTKLRRIYVSSLALSGSKLFDYLEIPSSASIKSDYPYYQTAASIDLSSLEKLICEWALGSEAPPIKRVNLIVDSDADLSLMLYTHRDAPLSLPPPFLNLSIHLNTSVVPLYVQILRPLPWAAIPCLQISGVGPSPSPTASQLFQVPFDAWKKSSFVSVTCLILVGVLIPPDVPLFPSLTILKVSKAPSNTLTLGWIVQFLRSSPNIEEAHLDTISSASPVDGVTVMGPLPVHLEKLAYLSIKSVSVSESKLFEYITLPTSAYVEATYPNALACPDQPVEFSSFEALVTHMCLGPHASLLDDMSLTVCKTHGSFILVVCALNDQEADAPFLELALPFVMSSMQNYLDLISRIPPALIETLSISDIHSSDLVSQWSPLIRASHRRKHGV